MAELSAHAPSVRGRGAGGRGKGSRSAQRKGEDQQATAAGLDLLRVLGWLVLHDASVADDPDCSIDHVLAGPSGVYVVNTVGWPGPISVRDDVLMVGSTNRSEALTDAAAAANLVRRLLGAIPVAPLLCFERLESVTGVVGEVALCASENILDLLTSQPEILDPAAVARASRSLSAAFRTTARPTVRVVEPAPVKSRPVSGPTLDELVRARSEEAGQPEKSDVSPAMDAARIEGLEFLMGGSSPSTAPVPSVTEEVSKRHRFGLRRGSKKQAALAQPVELVESSAELDVPVELATGEASATTGRSSDASAVGDAGAALWLSLTDAPEDVEAPDEPQAGDVESTWADAEAGATERDAEDTERDRAEHDAEELRRREADQARKRAAQEARENLEREARELAEREVLELEGQARLEQERLEQEAREQAEREEAARLDQELLELEQAARLEQERLEQQRLEQERLERAEREEAARLEQERLEQAAREQAEREEAVRLEQERLEQERLESEAREQAEREEQARLEQARVEQQAREQAEREEAARLEQERLEQERLEGEAREQAEREEQARLERERLAQEAREEAARLERERVEQEAREQADREEAARLEQERLEQEAREQAARLEQERVEQEAREEAARLERERVEQEAREQAEREETARLEQERLEQAARDQAARLEQERVEQEAREEAARLEQERLAQKAREQAEREEAARLERERVEQERLEREAREQAEREEAARLEQEAREQAERELADEAAARGAWQARLESGREARAREVQAAASSTDAAPPVAIRLPEVRRAEVLQPSEAVREVPEESFAVQPTTTEAEVVEPESRELEAQPEAEPQTFTPLIFEPDAEPDAGLDADLVDDLDAELAAWEPEVVAPTTRRSDNGIRAEVREAAEATAAEPEQRRHRVGRGLSKHALVQVAIAGLLIAGVIVGGPRVGDVVSWGQGLFAKDGPTTVGTLVTLPATTFHPAGTAVAGTPVPVEAQAGAGAVKGEHLVAVPLRIRNDGTTPWDVPVTAEAALIDALGVSHPVARTVKAVKGLPLLPGLAKVGPGAEVTGYVVFSVPNGRDLRSVTLGLAKTGDETVTWQVSP
jgi:hypothetical protein